ncbi:Uncharacterized protein TCAP_01387 [Tolypocladium capitatum]|uniref:Uncharacterized protein n=1 Tax=Tolypocladium capitatum TaxID=45235 RepID=A0A2K3QMD6_9HYPO|nr:Uncharacterized protein TCAP_01387 [Tolypocladium capitatum]
MSYFLPPTVSVPLEPRTEPRTEPHPPSQEIRRGKKPPSNRRSTSWGGWVRTIFPSRRRERGGTRRDKGFWEREDSADRGPRSRRRFTESRQSRMSETAGSDDIVRWNTAKDISESQLETAPARQRTASTAVGMGSRTNPGRKWSWAPRDRTDAWWPAESHDERKQPATRDGKVASPMDGRLAQSRQAMEAKEEARRQRRNLKESGDYLGVQGINPETGQLDIITPTDSDRSSTSQETQQKLDILRNALKDSRHSYKHAEAHNETAAQRVLRESEKHKLRRLEGDKQRPKTVRQSVKWRRQTKQWSSAQEPELSPIAQSRAGSVLGSSERPLFFLSSCPVVPAWSAAHVRDAGRASRHHAMEQAERATDEGLIALDSPARDSTSTPPRLHAPDARPHAERVVDTWSSTATVIRTPHRQSLAGLTPSAWELFANGISFDDSESSDGGRHQGGPVSPRASGEEVCTPAAGCSDEGRSPGREVSREVPRDLPLLQITTPGRTTVRLTDSPVKTPAKLSFLDRRAKRKMDSGGRDAKNGDPPAGSRATGHVSRQTLSPKRSFGLLRRRTSSSPPQPRDANPHESAERGLATSRKRSGTPKATSRDTSAEARIQTPTTRSPLRRFMPLYGTSKTGRRGESRNRHGSEEEEEVSLSALYPVTNVGQMCSSLEHATTFLPLKPADVAQELTVGNPASARDKSMNGLELEACRNGQKQSNADVEWMENAERDELTDERVSTPMTTTTVSTHAASSRSPAKGLKASPERPRRRARKRQPATVTSPSPKTLAGATRGGPGGATDTTSMGHLEATKQRSGMAAVRCLERAGTEEKHGATQRGTSPKSRYMAQPDKALGDDERPALGSAQESGQREATDGRADGLEERSLAARVPGAFPDHAGSEDGMGDDFGGTAVEEAGAEEEAECSICAAAKEAAWTVHCHATALLSLYWEIAGPVFDARSEYWERNARNEVTLADGFALVLAVPGAILGTTMLV